jgi:putative ABC transport system substrate-binding protein
MNNRRKLVIALGASAVVAQLASFAQQQGKVWRIGVLHSNVPATANYVLDVFREALQEQGFVDGSNIKIEYRFAEGHPERLPKLAAELVQANVDAIFAPSSLPARAAKGATTTIPIVFATVSDPVALGLVASLAKPGGNIAGTSILSVDLNGKRLQLLKEVLPKVTRVAVLTSSDQGGNLRLNEILAVGKQLGMETLSIKLNSREDINQAADQLRKWRADSLLINESATNALNRVLLSEFALQHRLPSMSGSTAYAEAGALMSYGASYTDSYKRAGAHVGKILKGAKPADIPVEQPTKFELAINMKTAKALGITIPNSILVQATKVIE